MKRLLLLSAIVGAIAATSASAAPRRGIPSTLASAITLDRVSNTVTLPIFRGEAPGREEIFFILTESSDFDDAVRRGINWSPKLLNALGTPAVQRASLEGADHHGRFSRGSTVHFEAGVDFSQKRLVVPGPNLFPVDAATHAGPIGDPGYSPLFTFGDGVVYNGGQIANESGVHAKVLALDPRHRTATLQLTPGFYEGRDVLYLSTDASVTQVAALEDSTFAPNLGLAPEAGSGDPTSSARLAILAVVNGPRGATNPERQGVQSAVAGEGAPLNIIREQTHCAEPTDTVNCSALLYSPLWDLHPVAWTQAAVDAGLSRRLTSHGEVEALFLAGLIENAAPNGPANQDAEILGLRAAGVVINCPPIFVAP